jgi:hypothetical protein
VPDYWVKFSNKSDHHALHNISSNPTAKKSKIDNNFCCILALNFLITNWTPPGVLHHSGQDDLAEYFAGDIKKVLQFLQFRRLAFLINSPKNSNQINSNQSKFKPVKQA